MDQAKKTEAIRILHVEDNKHDQVAFKRTFDQSDLDFSITCFDQGEKALESLGQQGEHPFDILVTDYGLPGITGLELCLRLLERQISFPMILLTGVGSEEMAVEALKSGIDDYIVKDTSNRRFEFLPYTIKALIQKHKEKRTRIKAEKALLKSEQQYKTLIETIPHGIQEIDTKGKILFGSPAYHHMLGYDNGKLIGLSLRDILPRQSNDRTMSYIKSLISAQPEPELYIDQQIKKDGTLIEVEVAWNYKRNKKGEITGFISVISDITRRVQVEEALRRYESIVSSSSDMQALLDPDYVYLAVNPSYLKLLNKTADEVIGRTPLDVFGEAFFNTVIKPQTERCLTGEDVRFQHWIDFPVIGRKYMDVAYSPYRGPNQDILGFVVTARDITGFKQAEERIRTLSQAVEQSPVSVVITKTDGAIEYVNAAFEHVTGYSAEEVIGRNPRLLKSGLTPKNRYKELWQTITKGKTWQGEFQNRKKNGEIFWERVNIAPVVDESGTTSHYLAVKEDITLRKKQEEQLLNQAHFDTLTSLPNRFLSLDRLSQVLKEAGRSKTMVGILFLDLDDFKKVNDTLGHEVGDMLLIEAAERLRGMARSRDTVGRLGGDEFIILLSGLSDVVDIRPVVKNIMEGFRTPFKIEGHELILSASVGISIYPNDGDTVSSLLRKADSAMYHAKALGRNTHAYHTDAMNREVSQRLELEEKMYGALDRGEFSVFYQPVLSVSSGRMVGAEALLRWRNPELDNVSPEDFISIAEQCGLIEALGQFVLCTALKMCARWHQKQDQGFHIAVNLSPRQFRNPKMVGFIEEALDRYGLSGEYLELEITEGVLMSGHRHVDDALAALSRLGVNISMDDFGTGYSSLSYLRSYPFDILKIDRSFVQDITADSADQALINASIAMAHGLNLEVVAEGVETKEQLAYLKKQGCDYAQGYLFAKAMPEDELLEWASKRDEML